VVFVSADGRALYTTSLHGGKRHLVVRDARPKSSPVYSPNGRSIVFSTGAGLWRVSAKGGHAKRIAAGGAAAVSWQPR
jgi:Tol biopolymer transport system component